MSEVLWRLYIRWTPGGEYSDESGRLIQATGSSDLLTPESKLSGGTGMIAATTLLLDNWDGRFSPTNAASPLYAALNDGGAYQAPGFLQVVVDGVTYTNVASFVIKAPQETPGTFLSPATVTLTCHDRGELLVDAKVSTGLYARRYDATRARFVSYTEADLICLLLEEAGLTDGADFVSQAWHTAHPTIAATIDPGFFPIRWFWMDDESVWQECQKLGAACLGYFLHSPGNDAGTPKGFFRYWSLANWLYRLQAGPSLVLTLNHYADAKPIYDDNELFSGVMVEVAGREPSEVGTLWEADELPTLAPGQTLSGQVAKFRQPGYSVIRPVSKTDLRASTAGGIDLTDYIELTAFDVYGQRAIYAIKNNHPRYHAVLRRLQIRGQALNGRPGQEVRADSALAFWTSDGRAPKVREVTGNAYIQTRRHGEMVAQFLRARHQAPRFTSTVNGVRGDPRRRLGDVVRLQNAPIGLDELAFVTGIQWTLDSKGFAQNLTLTDARRLYPRATYFTAGFHYLGQGGPHNGHLFW